MKAGMFDMFVSNLWPKAHVVQVWVNSVWKKSPNQTRTDFTYSFQRVIVAAADGFGSEVTVASQVPEATYVDNTF